MNTLIDFSSMGLLMVYVVGGLGVIFICYYAARHDERTARRNGAHVKSKHRDLALASELTACVPAQNTIQTDPYNYLFPSFPSRCSPDKSAIAEPAEQPAMASKKMTA